MKQLIKHVSSILFLAFLLSACLGGGDGSNVTVPNVVGQSQTQAVTNLTAAELIAGNISQQNSDTVATGNVISQTPASGTSVITGSAVNLVISSGVTSSVSSSATGNVSSDTSGVISIFTGTGAKIIVPEGSVPRTATGENGTIAFSIEKDTTTTLQVPSGITKSGDAYLFGPSGTIFAKPVAVTIPLSGTYSPDREYKLYRINQTTGVSEPHSAVYDPVKNTLTAQTYEFSPWWPGFGPAVDTANGCVNVDNTSSSIWRTVVTQQYTLKYTAADNQFNGASATWSNGAIGWTNHSDWYLPQGTYQMCVEGEVNNAPVHSELISVAINSPWHYNNPVCSQLGIGSVLLTLPGRCSTSPAPTTTVGTGDLQISLSWHSDSAVDLDLYVVEPSGEEIYYNHKVSAAGGTLDRDNKCSDYINGKPENIFWVNPPSGSYAVKVHFFSSCSGSATSMPFELRVVNKGVTTTFPGTATVGSGSSTFKTIIVGTGGGSGGSTCPTGSFSNKVTIGTGFNGTDITGTGTSFSLAALANGGDLYARIESASTLEPTRFSRLYVNDGIYSQKDFCSNCNTPPVLNCPNLMIGKFRITDIGSFSTKAYSVPMGGYSESYIGGSNIYVGQ
jgi:hypothetical protein